MLSGSIQMPKPIPISLMELARLAIPPVFFSLSYQSPKELESSSLCPNHPSSRTNSSAPRSFASFAMDSIFSLSKEKYTPSQELKRVGGMASVNLGGGM